MVSQDRSLFKDDPPYEQSPADVLSAYDDNAAVMTGRGAGRFSPIADNRCTAAITRKTCIS